MQHVAASWQALWLPANGHIATGFEETYTNSLEGHEERLMKISSNLQDIQGIW